MTNTIKSAIGLRGFHYYHTKEKWVPFLGQHLTFKREHNNPEDKFAVAGQAALPGRLAPVTVGHIPREISRYMWYAIAHGADVTGKVDSPDPQRSPLLQGGLEIKVILTIIWENEENEENMMKLKAKLESVSSEDYTDKSADILKDMDVTIIDSDEEY